MSGIEQKAPDGQFRVVSVDTFDGLEWKDDYSDKSLALKAADEGGGTMLKTHVYDDQGRYIGGGGTY